ncbi:MAG: hypothetical protein ACXWUG_16840 [Polyangiales bacterium]
MRPFLLACLLFGCARPAAGVAQPYGPQFHSARSVYQDPGSDVKLEPVSQTGYGISRRCAQGPLTLELAAVGDPIGEYVWLELRGPRHVSGMWEAKWPTVQVGPRGTFTTGSKAENERCLAPKQAPEQAGGVAAAPGSPGNPGTSSTGGTLAGKGEVVTFTKAELPPSPYGKVGFEVVVRIDPAVHAGDKLTLTIWSDTPQDWEGYVAWVEQGRLVPSDPAKWTAAREEAKKQKAQAGADSSAKVDRENKCRQLFENKKIWPPECEAEFPGLPQKDAAIMACWQVWKNQKLWTDACRKLTNLDPTKEQGPSGPPPPPLPDPRPPQPSVHAEWVPGSHHPNGASWVWSPGLWKVPKEDVDSGQTAKAPNAPPQPKVEKAPPQPSPDSVWCPGWWAFSVTGTGWIWIEGAWRIPPFAGATWREYRWVSAGGAFTLEPGGWFKK